MIRLFVEHTDYNLIPAVDINISVVSRYEKPLLVCAREGQKIRLNGLKESGALPERVSVVGWWDLGGQPLDLLFDYDAIFVLDPERIGTAEAREQWTRIIECLK